ncbi:MAG TPA: helix-turn-helix domain-containing protein [Devosia sp.]|nr:helix-turn-helix domain-containing protein [Devosia sp.]
MPETSTSTTTDLPARLLLIERRRELQRRLAPVLAVDFAQVPVVVDVPGGRPALELMRNTPYDLVIADLEAIADLGAATDERIGRVARAASGALIIILSEDAGISVALAAMRAGAHDCIGRDIDGPGLTRLIGELARRHGKSRCFTATAPQPEPASAAAEPAPSIPNMRDLVMPMWRQEQRIIEDAIQQFAGNVALAAAALELSPSTIYRKRQAWAEMDGRE